MIVYRISHVRFARLTASGREARWSSTGNFVLYTASNRSLACLENVVHRDREGLMGDYRILNIEIPEKVAIETVTLNQLPENWKSQETIICRQLGDTWIEKGKSCVLCVPSAIIPQETNYLINTQHPDFKFIKLLSIEEFSFDTRIKSA